MSHTPPPNPEVATLNEPEFARGSEPSSVVVSRVARVAEGIPPQLIYSVIDRYADGGGLMDLSDDSSPAEGGAADGDDAADENGRIKSEFLRIYEEMESVTLSGPTRERGDQARFYEGLLAESNAYVREHRELSIEYGQALQMLVDECAKDGRQLEQGLLTRPLRTLRLGFVTVPSEQGGGALQSVVAELDIRALANRNDLNYPPLSRDFTFTYGEDDQKYYVVAATRRDMSAIATDTPAPDMGTVHGGVDGLEYTYYYNRRECAETAVKPITSLPEMATKAAEAVVSVALQDTDRWKLSGVKAAFPEADHDGEKLIFAGSYYDKKYDGRIVKDGKELLQGLYQGEAWPTAEALHFFARSEPEIRQIIEAAKRVRWMDGLHEDSLDAKPLLGARLKWLEDNLSSLHRAATDAMYLEYRAIYAHIVMQLREVRATTAATKQFVFDFLVETPLPIRGGKVTLPSVEAPSADGTEKKK